MKHLLRKMMLTFDSWEIPFQDFTCCQIQDTQEAIDKMAADVEAQKAKRDKFSRWQKTSIQCSFWNLIISFLKLFHLRRRRHNPDNDIDYINERNMKFNQKCERFYGEYTKVCLKFSEHFLVFYFVISSIIFSHPMHVWSSHINSFSCRTSRTTWREELLFKV